MRLFGASAEPGSALRSCGLWGSILNTPAAKLGLRGKPLQCGEQEEWGHCRGGLFGGGQGMALTDH